MPPFRPRQPVEQRRIERLGPGRAERVDDALAVEEPLEIRVGGEPLAVTMRTPGHDEDLAAGFCLTESVVCRADDLDRIEPCAEAEFGNRIDVWLAEEAAAGRAGHVDRARRAGYLSSSCGLCGKQSIDRVRQAVPPRPAAPFTVARDVLSGLPDALRAAQPTFEATGGLHAAGFFSAEGRPLICREDVGRHNAVDKVVGAALRTGRLPLAPGVLMVSGRASFEIMQKAAMAGAAFVAAVSAPSSLAVDFALETNMTLVGFLREGRMNVYAGGERVNSKSEFRNPKQIRSTKFK